MRRRKLKVNPDVEMRQENVEGFFMRQISAVVNSEEWGGYEVTVKFSGRKILCGFEMKSPSITAFKIS